MTAMSPPRARELWKALVDNASRLIDDARLLLANGSPGRARSLTVLAQEELGKALWIYDAFSLSWSRGDDAERTVDMLRSHSRDHVRKYMEAVVFGGQLDEFWGGYGRVPQPAAGETLGDFIERRRAKAEAAAKAANLAKQSGFYVDISADGATHTPDRCDVGDVAGDLTHAAQVVEMLLISDHTRMKHDAATPYDSTLEQQFRLLPTSHPEELAAWLDAGQPAEDTDNEAQQDAE